METQEAAVDDGSTGMFKNDLKNDFKMIMIFHTECNNILYI